MEYKEIKRFRDGTYMVEDPSGKKLIVDAEMNNLLKEKNWSKVATRKLQSHFPHMLIEYVDEDMPGISIRCANGDNSAFGNWGEDTPPDVIYVACLDIVGQLESDACLQDKEYFMNHYIKTNRYE